MLTTAGPAARAAAEKLVPETAAPAAAEAAPAGPGAAAGAWITVGVGSKVVRRPSHSGLSVATTNSTATATVTACEKINQVLCILRSS